MAYSEHVQSLDSAAIPDMKWCLEFRFLKIINPILSLGVLDHLALHFWLSLTPKEA